MYLAEIERKQRLLIEQRNKEIVRSVDRRRKKSGVVPKVATLSKFEEKVGPNEVEDAATTPQAEILKDVEVVVPDLLHVPPKPASQFVTRVTTVQAMGESTILETIPLVIPEEKEPDMKIVDVVTRMIGVPVPIDLHARMSEYLKRNKDKDGPRSLKQLAVRCLRIGFAALDS